MIKNVAVRTALLEKGFQIQDVAKQLGYTRGHISGVINGRLESFKVKKAIALLVGRGFDSLWTAGSRAETEKTA